MLQLLLQYPEALVPRPTIKFFVPRPFKSVNGLKMSTMIEEIDYTSFVTNLAKGDKSAKRIQGKDKLLSLR